MINTVNANPFASFNYATQAATSNNSSNPGEKNTKKMFLSDKLNKKDAITYAALGSAMGGLAGVSAFKHAKEIGKANYKLYTAAYAVLGFLLPAAILLLSRITDKKD